MEPIEEPVESSEVSFGNTSSDQFEVLGCEFRERDIDGDLVIGCQFEQFVEFVRVGWSGPGGDGSFAEALVGVGDEFLEREARDATEASAVGAGTERAMEAEESRFDLCESSLAAVAGRSGRPGCDDPLCPIDGDCRRRVVVRLAQQQAVAFAASQGLLHAVLDPAEIDLADLKSIEYDPGGVEMLIVGLVEVNDRAVWGVGVADSESAESVFGQSRSLLCGIGFVSGDFERHLDSSAIEILIECFGDGLGR